MLLVALHHHHDFLSELVPHLTVLQLSCLLILVCHAQAFVQLFPKHHRHLPCPPPHRSVNVLASWTLWQAHLPATLVATVSP